MKKILILAATAALAVTGCHSMSNEDMNHNGTNDMNRNDMNHADHEINRSGVNQGVGNPSSPGPGSTGTGTGQGTGQ